MADGKAKFSRRGFLAGTAAAGAFTIVPRHVLGGPRHVPPSDTFGAALIGCGGRGPGTFKSLHDKHGLEVRQLARCDVKYVGRADNKTIYTDFRRVLERKDIDIVAIATPPHWHALISIAAMAAGKDVLCEKPMTRFIADGRAIVNAAKRYGLGVGVYEPPAHAVVPPGSAAGHGRGPGPVCRRACQGVRAGRGVRLARRLSDGRLYSSG